MSIKALIPVRSGSLRVKNKNIRPFANSSLLEIKIRQMKRIQAMGLIDGVVVNSNCDEMLGVGKRLGAECIKREQKFAMNNSKINDVYVDIAKHFDADLMLYVNCTNPLLSDIKLIESLKIYKNKKGDEDTLNSCHYVKEFLWRMDGGKSPINYDLSNIPRSQDLPNIVALNFAINIVPTQQMIEQKSIVGKNPILFLLDEIESVDIDNEIDFEFAEFLYQKITIVPPPQVAQKSRVVFKTLAVSSNEWGVLYA